MSDQLTLPTANTTITPSDFARAFRRVPAAVAVVLVRTASGVVRGITCTSVTSLSASPPMVLFCADRKTLFAEEIRLADRYSINFLAEDRHAWARAFARGDAALNGLAHVIGIGRSGVPTLSSGTTAVLECAVADIHRGGDHWIVTGHISHARSQSDAVPLGYLAGRYGHFVDRENQT